MSRHNRERKQLFQLGLTRGPPDSAQAAPRPPVHAFELPAPKKGAGLYGEDDEEDEGREREPTY